MLLLPETFRVLVVEDDAEDYRFTERVVRAALPRGIAISWAQCLEDAIRLRGERVSDLLLLDYNLPGANGDRVLHAFRERGWLEPAIMLTSLDDRSAHAQALESGADDFLSKNSLDAVALERAVRYVLERGRAETALRRQAELHQGLFDGSPFPKIVYDEETLRILDVNRAAVNLYGYTREELLSLTVLDIRPPEEVEQVRDTLRQLAGYNGTIQDGRSRHQTKGGRVLQVEVTSNSVMYNGRRARIGEVVDMTERLTAEDALRDTERRLLQSQKMEAVGQLAGGIAHDFNNVLTAIQGYSELVRHALPAESDLREDLNEVIAASQRAAQLTRQLLAFSRRQVMQPSILDLEQVVRDMQGMLERLLGEDLELVFDVGKPLGLVRADRTQIEQVLVNLAVNARDAMPDGGVLAIRMSNLFLDDAFVASHPGAPAGPCIGIAVTDTGVGMSPEVQQRLFEPFFTTKQEGRGSGLGLATVYGIVKQSGGYISVWSMPGVGSEFTVYLPEADGVEFTDAEAPAVLTDQANRDDTILLVEDAPSVRTVVRRSLESFGYTVLEATNGLDALAMLDSQRERIDMIVTDLVMPKMGGRGLVEAMQSRGMDIPVLVMSGYVNDAAWRQGVFPRGAHFIAKPFTGAEIARRVREVLEGASAAP